MQLITPYNTGNPLQPAYQDNFHLPDPGTWDQTQNLPALECFWWLAEKLTEGEAARSWFVPLQQHKASVQATEQKAYQFMPDLWMLYIIKCYQDCCQA